MNRVSNTTGVSKIPAVQGLMLPYYGDGTSLSPGWVISDGEIHNGYQTIDYPDNVCLTGWAGNSNNVWGGVAWNANINRPENPFTGGTAGSAHTHTMTGVTETDEGVHQDHHKHSAENVESRVTLSRRTLNTSSGGRVSNVGNGTKYRFMNSTDLNPGLNGRVLEGNGTHRHGTIMADEPLEVSGEKSTADPAINHRHHLTSDESATKYASITVRMIVFVGYE